MKPMVMFVDIVAICRFSRGFEKVDAGFEFLVQATIIVDLLLAGPKVFRAGWNIVVLEENPGIVMSPLVGSLCAKEQIVGVSRSPQGSENRGPERERRCRTEGCGGAR